MKTLAGPGPSIVTLVCCVHGDELIGEVAYNHYQPIIDQYPGLRLIFAHEDAYSRNTRFIDADLNRSFPGDPNGAHESRLASQILPMIREAKYVIDLHTTVTDIRLAPIVANLGPDTLNILNLSSGNDIALMQHQIARNSLIGQVDAGVSLEFNQDYATTPGALAEITAVIDGLLSRTPHKPQPRRIYHIEGTISNDTPLPRTTRNFMPVPGTGMYPFLFGEGAYPHHQGFYAKTVTSQTI